MPNNVIKTRSAASVAVNVAGNGSAQTELLFLDRAEVPASRRISEIHDLIRVLLLDDSLAREQGKDVLVGVVADDLEGMAAELEQMAGLQRCFESWAH